MDRLAFLTDEVAAMATSLRAADLTSAVPACPGWTRQDLANHITAVHRWVLGALDNAGSPPYDDSVVSSPDDYADVSTALVKRLAELPVDAPCWTFHPEDKTAGFWRRRQLQEVSIHRWDVDEHEIDPEVAADGIGEVVEFFLPRMIKRGTAVPDGTVILEADGRSWAVRDTDGPRAVVSADAATLNLLLWGRRTLKDTSVEGDEAFATAFFDAALTP